MVDLAKQFPVAQTRCVAVSFTFYSEPPAELTRWTSVSPMLESRLGNRDRHAKEFA
jgi:hypothetical protein